MYKYTVKCNIVFFLKEYKSSASLVIEELARLDLNVYLHG